MMAQHPLLSTVDLLIFDFSLFKYLQTVNGAIIAHPLTEEEEILRQTERREK